MFLLVYECLFFGVKKCENILEKKFIDIKKIGCAKSFVLIFFYIRLFFFDVYKKTYKTMYINHFFYSNIDYNNMNVKKLILKHLVVVPVFF